MRAAEVALFLVPFVLYAAWRIATATARPAWVWGALVFVVLLVAGTISLGLSRREPPTDRYIPARIVGDSIVPGSGVPK